MRRMKLVVGVVAVLAITGLVASYAVIDGSAHDFESLGWSGGEICAPCHTPHNAQAQIANGAPLWDHANTTATFTPYDSATLDAPDVTLTIGGISLQCLSCHDGTVALDAFGGASGVPTLLTGDTLLGTDLSDDHPVSFTYDAALVTADGELVAFDDAGVAALLFAGEVECSSCHDVHNGAGFDGLLRMSNAGSALCLTCHDK